jgi:hypothetical protein
MTIVLVTVCLLFIAWLWAMHKVEVSLNAEGDSLWYPWKVPSTRKEIRRIDGVLSTSIQRLMSGEDEEEVLSTLQRNACGLRGEAARHMERAILRLKEASGRDWMFDTARREEDREGAVNELWRARAEHLREMI